MTRQFQDTMRLATITAECGRLIQEAGASGIARAEILAGVRKVVPDATDAEFSQRLAEVCSMPVTVKIKDGVRVTPDIRRRLDAARTRADLLDVLADLMKLNGATHLGEIVEVSP